MNFPALRTSSGVSLQAQTTPIVLGQNGPFTAGRNNTACVHVRACVCVCVVTPHISSAEQNSMSSFRVHLLFCLQKRKMLMSMLQHMLHYRLFFLCLYCVCVSLLGTSKCSCVAAGEAPTNDVVSCFKSINDTEAKSTTNVIKINMERILV